MRYIIILINSLCNNPQFIQKLADSYPIRRAAQLFVYMYYRNKNTALEFKNSSQLEGLKLTEKLKKICEELKNQNDKLK